MIRSIFFFIFLFLLCALIPLTATAEPVNIADPNLRVAIEKTLGKAPGALITTTEMATLTELSAPNANITDLTGLEAATNLLRLYLNDRYVAVEGRFINSNAISNLSPLSGLTHLTRLHLDGNSITDLSPLVANTGFGQGAEIVVSETRSTRHLSTPISPRSRTEA